ncbi:MAG: PilZ domain-containing protein [Roseiarcus sp.]|jgi:hypothetical protein
MPLSEPESERRRRDRVVLTLPGRYLLADGMEFPCEIVEVSSIGVAIRGPMVGDLGERVVAYVQELGRIEGVIVRRAADWFAIDLRVPSSRLQKIGKKIDWLVRQQADGLPEQRSQERVDQAQELTTLRSSDGREFSASLIDASTKGAALYVDVAPPVGAAVTVGEQPAHVSRHLEGGIAVTFDREASAEAFQEIERARACEERD